MRQTSKSSAAGSRSRRLALSLVELVAAVIALIARMRAINLELTKRVAHLTPQAPAL